MANSKISALPSTTLVGTEIVPVSFGGTNYGVTAAQIAALKTAGGSTYQVQYNNAGAFAGSSNVTIDPTTGTLQAGAYRMSSTSVITEATTSRTLSVLDNGKFIYVTNSSPITITTAAGLGVGFSCAIIQGGAGQITFVQGTSTIMVSYGSLVRTPGQYATVSIINPVADTFILAGQLA